MFYWPNGSFRSQEQLTTSIRAASSTALCSRPSIRSSCLDKMAEALGKKHHEQVWHGFGWILDDFWMDFQTDFDFFLDGFPDGFWSASIGWYWLFSFHPKGWKKNCQCMEQLCNFAELFVINVGGEWFSIYCTVYTYTLMILGYRFVFLKTAAFAAVVKNAPPERHRHGPCLRANPLIVLWVVYMSVFCGKTRKHII